MTSEALAKHLTFNVAQLVGMAAARGLSTDHAIAALREAANALERNRDEIEQRSQELRLLREEPAGEA